MAVKAEDVPKLPDPTKRKHYRLFVAKLQFAAAWIRFDIPFVLSFAGTFLCINGSRDGVILTTTPTGPALSGPDPMNPVTGTAAARPQ